MNVVIVRNAEAATNASIRRVASALIEGGHRPVILSRNRNCSCDSVEYIEKKINIDGTDVKNFELQLSGKTEKGLKNITVLKKYMSCIKKWLEKNRADYDVIHAFDLDSGLPSKKISKKYQKKLVYHIADFYVDSRAKIPGMMKSIISGMEYDIINYADDTIICTDERREQIKGSNPKKLSIVYNSPGIDEKIINIIDENNIDMSENLDKIKICYIGMLSKRRFIDCVLQVVSEHPEVELTLGGSGDLAEMAKDYSEKYPNIDYLGKVDYEDTFRIYSKSNLMFAIYNPEIRNHRYSAANKIYEAMLLKKPIIVAKDTSMDKIVEKYDIGYVIDFSRDEFSSLIENLISNRKQLLEKSNNMEGLYEKYSWDKMKQVIKDIYRNLQK